MTETTRTLIGPEERCLQGHFPGNPLVPGVVILERVIEAIARREVERVRVSHVPVVKFLSPLHPGEPLIIELEPKDASASVRFSCRVGTRAVAAGVVTMRAVAN